MSVRTVGKLPGTLSVYEIGFDGIIQSADELIFPVETEDFLAPGFIDVQVNGFAGVDYNDPATSTDQILRSIRTMVSTGVTRFYPTVITGSKERITGALRNLAAAKKELEEAGVPEAAAIEGIHVEGPHISAEDGPRGAHPAEHVRPPDFNEFEQWQNAAGGLVRLVTVSPEWPEAPEYIRAVRRSGVVVSIGHTKATTEQILAAINAGATMSTHLGNGAHSVLPKTGNYIWDQLSADELSPSFIVDGIHIPQVFLRCAIRMKGVEKSVLVTDAAMPAMCQPGVYRLGSVEVELKPGNRVVLRGQERLAGSALRFDDGIALAVKWTGLSLREVLSMATVNPARVCRIAGRQRGLQPGEKADIVRFRWNEADYSLLVVETILNGKTVYSNE